jgi:hypothetical protein
MTLVDQRGPSETEGYRYSCRSRGMEDVIEVAERMPSQDWIAERDDDSGGVVFLSPFLYEIQEICQIMECDPVPLLRNLPHDPQLLGQFQI